MTNGCGSATWCSPHRSCCRQITASPQRGYNTHSIYMSRTLPSVPALEQAGAAVRDNPSGSTHHSHSQVPSRGCTDTPYMVCSSALWQPACAGCATLGGQPCPCTTTSGALGQPQHNPSKTASLLDAANTAQPPRLPTVAAPERCYLPTCTGSCWSPSTHALCHTPWPAAAECAGVDQAQDTNQVHWMTHKQR